MAVRMDLGNNEGSNANAENADPEMPTSQSPPPSYRSNKGVFQKFCYLASCTECSLPSSNAEVVQHYGQPQLVVRTQRLVALRDFHAEIRGQLDVENYLSANTAVLLDVEEIELEEILARMIEARPGQFLDAISRKKSRRQKAAMVRPCPYIPFASIKDKIFTNLNTIIGESRSIGANSLHEYLQAIVPNEEHGILEDQSWFGIYCALEDLPNPRISFARLNAPTNFSATLREVRFILLVAAPLKQKETKSALEIARTFGTLLSDASLRNELTNAENEHAFIAAIREKAREMAQKHGNENGNENGHKLSTESANPKWYPGRGLLQDLRRRLPYYKSDYLDGIADSRALQKTISSAAFLFFIVLPTAIALGMLNEENTHDRINVKKVILGQWIGGILFGIFGGQLFLVVLTSPPISIYIKVIDRISTSTGLDFYQLYTGIGLWCCFYLFLFAIFEASNVMRYAKRSLEELFSMFIACTLTIEAVKATVRMLHRAFLPHCLDAVPTPHPSMEHPNPDHLPPPHGPPPPPPPLVPDLGAFHLPPHLDPLNCDRSVGLLFILLMLGTAWLALTLSNFRKTPFLGKRKRELVSDYALPLAVCAMTLGANFWFGDVPKETFDLNEHTPSLTLGPFWRLPMKGQLICCVLGFPLTILFAMDQMIVTNTVDNSQNNLKKGPAANWDFLVVAIINIPLSLFGLPWMHAALPQSYLHLKAQADVEDRLQNGTIQPVIVKNRESRLAILLAHLLMIPTYFFALHHLRHFPTSVFHGVFLFLAYSSTIGNELCQRVLLLLTEQRSYPPTHFIRRVPQRIVHLFTGTELLQLALLLAIGHFPWPVIRLLFPVALIVFIPLRALMFPRIFKKEHLEVLDGAH